VARPDLAADRARAFALVPVSREKTARLDRFTALLLDWQSRINLIAASTVPVLWTRHIADSLQLLAIAPDARKWVDLGSGGGFPGVPIACALAEQGSAEVHLIESNKKKAAFLREAVRITGAPAIVHAVRIADFCQSFRGALDAVTARALAPLPELLSIAYPLLKKGPQGVFPKGQDVEAELTEAAKCWSIQASLVPSRTDPESRVVLIRRAEPTRKQ
jgi:16S rRNA (guanine527-N7)-methyltransferase